VKEKIAVPKSLFPPKTLKEAISIPKAIFEKNAGKPIFNVTLAQELSLKANARTYRDLITASGGYGLTSGSYSAHKIELQPRGEELLGGSLDAVFEALFSVELFKKFYDHFATGGSKGIPSENVAMDFLRSDCAVPDKQCNALLANIMANARDWYLIQDIAGAERFVAVELARKKASANGDWLVTEAPSEAAAPDVKETIPANYKDGIANATLEIPSRLHLTIEIHIAGDTPEDKIESIFRNMNKYLLSHGQS
jgi:hypothetical protein